MRRFERMAHAVVAMAAACPGRATDALRRRFGRHSRIAVDVVLAPRAIRRAAHCVCNGGETLASSHHRIIVFTPGEPPRSRADRGERRMKAEKPMQQLRRALALLPTLASAGLLGGCAAAPSIPIAGAYFPAWLVCSLIGVLGAIAARMVFEAAGLAQVLPLQLLVCLSVGLVCATVAWAFWIGL
jgi:hypothetical protein